MGKHNQESFWNSKSLLLGRRFLFQLQSQILLVALIVILPASAVSQTCLPNGDINQDGNITASDALLAFQHALGIADPPLNSCQLTLADVYPIPTAPDGQITASDALCVFQRALSLVSCLDTTAGTPTADSVSFSVDFSIPYVEKQLIGTDPDGDTLTYELVDNPTGPGYSLAVIDSRSGILYLTVAPGFTGEITLHYRVTDGRLWSSPATIRIAIESVVDDQGLGAELIDPVTYAEFSEGFAIVPEQVELPDEIDWSADFPIPSAQGTLGSCVGWATAYALKSYQERKEEGWALNTSSHRFSPAYIFNQIKLDKTRKQGGSKVNDALDLIVKQGVSTLATMPYDEDDFRTQPSAAARQEAAKFKAKSWEKVEGTKSVKKHLVLGRPVVINMMVCGGFHGIRGLNSVYNTLGDNTDCGGHAVTIVGYDDRRFSGAFKAINSWGTKWGDGGYFWLPYDFASRMVEVWVDGQFYDMHVLYGAFVLHDAENTGTDDSVDPPAPVPVTLPNLQIADWKLRFDSHAGGSGWFEFEVVNAGTGTARAGAAVSLIFSDNPTISSADHIIMWETIPFDLRPGRSAVRDEDNRIAFTFPNHLPEGVYYVAVWVDGFDVVRESNEEDNISFADRLATIENSQPDLYVENWYAQWDNYGTVELTYKIKNIGKSQAPKGWDIEIFLSSDLEINSGDILLWVEEAKHSINPGHSLVRNSSGPARFRLYFDGYGDPVPPGSYYMVFSVDILDKIQESNEFNNTSFGWSRVSIPYRSPVVAGDEDTPSPVREGDGPHILPHPFVEPSRVITNRLYNGHELPTHDMLIKKVQISRTDNGGMIVTSMDELDTLPMLSVGEADDDPVSTRNREAANKVIFPVVEAIPMPVNNPVHREED